MIDAFTKLLLHSNTVAGSTSFQDYSGNAHAVTASGDTHHSGVSKQFGNTSILFDGTGDFLSIPDSPDWHFGTGDFTIDFWVSRLSFGTNQPIIGQSNLDGTGGFSWYLEFTNTDKIKVGVTDTGLKGVQETTGTTILNSYSLPYDTGTALFVIGETVSGLVGVGTVTAVAGTASAGTLTVNIVTPGFTDNEPVTGSIAGAATVNSVTGEIPAPVLPFVHIGIVRHGDNLLVFCGGILEATLALPVNYSLHNSLNGLGIGVLGENTTHATPLHAYIDELRVSKGVSRWIADYVPPVKFYGTFGSLMPPVTDDLIIPTGTTSQADVSDSAIWKLLFGYSRPLTVSIIDIPQFALTTGKTFHLPTVAHSLLHNGQEMGSPENVFQNRTGLQMFSPAFSPYNKSNIHMEP